MSGLGNRARLGPLVAVLLGAAVYVFHTWSAHAPDLVSNDGIQYLEGARTLARGEGFGTSILIYDPNFTSGALPTSQTTFPPGYPLLIALGITLGCSPVVAGLLASLAGGLSAAALLFRTLGGWVGAWAALLALLNLHGTILTIVIASDIVFTALATGALIRLAAGLGENDRRALWQGGALAGAAFACRFAGTFLLGAVGVYFGLRWLKARTRAHFFDAVAAGLPGAVIMGALFLRNLVLSGDADGGALDDFVRPWSAVLSEFFWGCVTLFGVATPDTSAFWVELGAFVLALGLVARAVLRAPAPTRTAAGAWSADPLVRLCVVFVGLYLAALLYLSHTRNSIVLLPRYLLPLLPPLLLVAGRALRGLMAAGVLSARHGALVGGATLIGLVAGGWSYLPAMRATYLEGNPARRIAAHLDAPASDGRTLRQVFAAQVPLGAPLLAEPGHALGFELDHPVIGPIGATYSGRTWDAAEVRTAVSHYDVRWAVRVRGLSPVAHIPRFWLDVDANGPPPWLVPVFEAPDATLYRIALISSTIQPYRSNADAPRSHALAALARPLLFPSPRRTRTTEGSESMSTRTDIEIFQGDAGQGLVKAWTRGVAFDEKAKQQVRRAASMPFIYKWVAVMPDVHAGLGATVGSVIPTQGAIIPAAVGVDIGCGMMAVRTSLKASDLPDDLHGVRTAIEAAVPHGRTNDGRPGDKGAFDTLPEPHAAAWTTLLPAFDAICEKHPKLKRGSTEQHLGTLGTGNHFIEVCLDAEQHVWVMLHSGSRGVGNRIGSYFIEKAKYEMERWYVHLPEKDLAYLPEGSQHFDDYRVAVGWAQEFAATNRELMMEAVLGALRGLVAKGELPPFEARLEAVNCHHNYIAKEKHYGERVWVTRKGAVRAGPGELGIIPGSMGARSYIVRGKGNEESFHSCSHGAGRVMSRTEAKRRFTLEDHARATEGVECRKDADVIDETPAAYKPIDAVMEAQKDLVEIVYELKQVVCVKG